jgi:hypothetical protein
MARYFEMANEHNKRHFVKSVGWVGGLACSNSISRHLKQGLANCCAGTESGLQRMIFTF